MLIHFDPLVPSAKGRRLSDALAGRDTEDLLRVFISDLRESSAGSPATVWSSGSISTACR